MNGEWPEFTYPMLESWAAMTRRAPEPFELEALFLLDGAYRFPDAPVKAAT